MTVTPYLNFNGRAEEAFNFYKQAADAELEMLMRFKDNPESPPPGSSPSGNADKILHMSFKIAGSSIMASDGYCTGSAASFEGITLALTAETDADAERKFAALSQGGTVQMPLTRTFFSSKFGMLKDKFGVGWMVLVAQAQ